jgi:hypothetical protein
MNTFAQPHNGSEFNVARRNSIAMSRKGCAFLKRTKAESGINPSTGDAEFNAVQVRRPNTSGACAREATNRSAGPLQTKSRFRL